MSLISHNKRPRDDLVTLVLVDGVARTAQWHSRWRTVRDGGWAGYWHSLLSIFWRNSRHRNRNCERYRASHPNAYKVHPAAGLTAIPAQCSHRGYGVYIDNWLPADESVDDRHDIIDYHPTHHCKHCSWSDGTAFPKVCR